MKNYHPAKKGFIKLNISHKDIHSIFSKRRVYWTNEFSIWYNPFGCRYLLIEDMTLKAKIIHTLAFPFVILLSIINAKEIFLDWKNSFNRLEKGKFTSDTIYPPNPLTNVRSGNGKYWLKIRGLHMQNDR